MSLPTVWREPPRKWKQKDRSKLRAWEGMEENKSLICLNIWVESCPSLIRPLFKNHSLWTNKSPLSIHYNRIGVSGNYIHLPPPQKISLTPSVQSRDILWLCCCFCCCYSLLPQLSVVMCLVIFFKCTNWLGEIISDWFHVPWKFLDDPKAH